MKLVKKRGRINPLRLSFTVRHGLNLGSEHGLVNDRRGLSLPR